MFEQSNTTMLCSIEELHNAQLNILLHLHKVCEKHHINYYLAFGTCIGAMRHKGFIPWDSDIDVLMYKEDIDKLCSVAQINEDGFFIQTYETDKQYPYANARLRDSKTTFIEYSEADRDFNHGVYIDIYPLFVKPKNKIKYHMNIFRAYLHHLLVYGKPLNGHGQLIYYMTRMTLKFYSEKKRMKKIKQIESKLCNNNSDEVLDYFGEDIGIKACICYSKEWFAAPSKIEFEGHVFYGPTNPDEYLRKRYGNYMELPPVDKQVLKLSNVFIDIRKSYTEYRGIEYLK